MSKFKNKKALALSVGAIMAGVSVIGVVAACAPTKAKPNKPSQGTQNPSQSGGSQSTNPGSGSTTTPTGQGSNSGGTTNTNPGSGSTTSPSKQGSENNTTNPSTGSTNTNPETSPKDGAGSSNTGKDTTKQEDKKMQDDQPGTNGGTTEKPKDGQGTETPDKPKVGSGEGTTETGKNEQPKEGSGSGDNKKPGENAGSGESDKQQSGSDSENGKKTDSDTQQATPVPKENEMKDKPGETNTDNPSTDGWGTGMEGSPGTNAQQNDAEKDQAELNKKKQDAKTKVSNSVYLLESDKKSFNEKIVEIKSNEQVGKIQEILNEATKKENERKEKLTPTKSNLNVLAGRNYLHFEFKTSKDTFDKIKEKKFKMLISLVGFDGTPYESQEDNAASLASTDDGPYIRGTQLKDGSMLVYIESLRYFNESTAAPEGKYKLVKLWDADDENKADLLNAHSQEIEIRYKKKQ